MPSCKAWAEERPIGIIKGGVKRKHLKQGCKIKEDCIRANKYL